MGTVSEKINTLQQQLQKTNIVSQRNNIQQVKKLNNLESQAWLYEGILERIGNNSLVNHEKIARTLEALEYKRDEILQELEPRRPLRYRVLAGIQNSAREILASQAEKDYEQLEKIVTNLVVFTKSRQPSQVILSEVIKKLASEISERSDQISPYRLRLAYKVDELMKVLSARLIIGSSSASTDSDYRLLTNELYSRINLLSGQFNNLLKIRQENISEIYNRGQKISSLARSISELHGVISNYEADLVASRMNANQLRELAQSKQNQIDNLENSISILESDVQISRQDNQSQQDQNNYLKNQLSQLKREKTALQESIQDVTDYIQQQEAELTALQHEKDQLSVSETEIQRKYRELSQNYQQKKIEISDLNKQLETLSAINQSKPQSPTRNLTKLPIKKVMQPSVEPVVTKSRISIAEYQKITNQNEYVYVREHLRKGRLVKAHYRRRRSSR